MLISEHIWVNDGAIPDICDECGTERAAPIEWLPDLFIYREFGGKNWSYEETSCIFREK